MPAKRSPATTLSKMLMVGKGLGRWKTIPTRLRTSSAGVDGPVDVEVAQPDAALDPPAGVVVEAVDRPQQRRLAAP